MECSGRRTHRSRDLPHDGITWAATCPVILLGYKQVELLHTRILSMPSCRLQLSKIEDATFLFSVRT